METHLIYPIVGTVIYLSYPKNLEVSRSIVKNIAIVHNTFLTLFSLYTFINCLYILMKYGLVFRHNYYFTIPHFDKIMFLFYLSKYYEYIDTFLIYLNKKKPIFLQTFHHIGAVVCWHLCYYYKVDGVFLPTLMNSLVHTVMYTYYLSTLLKFNLRSIKIYITSLQMLQFFMGNVVVPLMYYPPIETKFNYSIILLFTSYVCVLMVLFSLFSYNTYFVKKAV